MTHSGMHFRFRLIRSPVIFDTLLRFRPPLRLNDTRTQPVISEDGVGDQSCEGDDFFDNQSDLSATAFETHSNGIP